MTQTKLHIVKTVNRRTGIERNTCALVVDTALEAIRDALIEGDSVQLRGFGTFSRKKRKAKACRDIKRNSTVMVPEHDIPHFKPVRELTVAVADIPEIK